MRSWMLKCPLVAAHCGLCLHTNTTQVPSWMYAGTMVGQARLEYGTILVRMYRMLQEFYSLQRYLCTYTMYIPLYKRIIRHGHARFILITMGKHKGGTYMEGRIIERIFMLIPLLLTLFFQWIDWREVGQYRSIAWKQIIDSSNLGTYRRHQTSMNYFVFQPWHRL